MLNLTSIPGGIAQAAEGVGVAQAQPTNPLEIK
jgi:hypothetical protein